MSYKKLKEYLEAWETKAAAKRTAIWTAARTEFLARETAMEAKRRPGMKEETDSRCELTHRIEQIQRDLEVLADLIRNRRDLCHEPPQSGHRCARAHIGNPNAPQKV